MDAVVVVDWLISADDGCQRRFLDRWTAEDGERSDDNLVWLERHSTSLDLSMLSTIWDVGGAGLVNARKGFVRPGTTSLNVNGKFNAYGIVAVAGDGGAQVEHRTEASCPSHAETTFNIRTRKKKIIGHIDT